MVEHDETYLGLPNVIFHRFQLGIKWMYSNLFLYYINSFHGETYLVS